MKGPLCPTCQTETSLERGDVLVVAKSLDMISGDVMDGRLSRWREDSDLGCVVLLKSCWQCWRNEALPDRPHTLWIMSWEKTKHSVHKSLALAQEALEAARREYTSERRADTTLKIKNLLHEVVEEETIDNGNPTREVWRSKFGPFTLHFDMEGHQKDSREIHDEAEAHARYEQWVRRMECGDTPFYTDPRGPITATLNGRQGEVVRQQRFDWDADAWKWMRQAYTGELELFIGDKRVYGIKVFPYTDDDSFKTLESALGQFERWRSRLSDDERQLAFAVFQQGPNLRRFD